MAHYELSDVDTCSLAVRMERHTCSVCGGPFLVPARLGDRCRENPSISFFCPAGHSLSYGKSQAQKDLEAARAEAKAAKAQLDAKHKDLVAQSRQVEALGKKVVELQDQCGTLTAEVMSLRNRPAKAKDESARAAWAETEKLLLADIEANPGTPTKERAAKFGVPQQRVAGILGGLARAKQRTQQRAQLVAGTAADFAALSAKQEQNIAEHNAKHGGTPGFDAPSKG